MELSHWSLSRARSIQSIPPHPISLRFILIPYPPTYVLVFLVVSFPLAFPPISYIFSPIRATSRSPLILLDLIILIIPGEEYKLWRSLLCSFLQPPVKFLKDVCSPQIPPKGLMDEWSPSHSRRFNPFKRPSATHWTGGWMSTRTGLDAVTRKVLSLMEMDFLSSNLWPVTLIMWLSQFITEYSQVSRFCFASNNARRSCQCCACLRHFKTLFTVT
jgi:hypothetical protein